MTSSQPYLLRAMYQWIIDNDMTPQLLVDAGHDGVQVPRQYVREGKIVLNIAPRSVRDLELGNDRVSFSARFGGRAFDVIVPVAAVRAIYARESGKGMMFVADNPDTDPPQSRSGGTPQPRLRLVK
jgi:stringent starvation protein B